MSERTPYLVYCPVHECQFLTREQYIAQLSNADSLWLCPICGREATFDDENYEAQGAPEDPITPEDIPDGEDIPF